MHVCANSCVHVYHHLWGILHVRPIFICIVFLSLIWVSKVLICTPVTCIFWYNFQHWDNTYNSAWLPLSPIPNLNSQITKLKPHMWTRDIPRCRRVLFLASHLANWRVDSAPTLAPVTFLGWRSGWWLEASAYFPLATTPPIETKSPLARGGTTSHGWPGIVCCKG